MHHAGAGRPDPIALANSDTWRFSARTLGRLPRGAQLDEELREPVVRLGQPLLHAAADHPVAIFLRGRDRPDREQGPTLVLGEGRGLDEDVPGHRLVLEGLDDPLRRDDLAVLAAEAVRRPVWRAVDEPPLAARPDVHLVDLRRVGART